MDFGHEASAPRRVRKALEPLIATPGDPIADDVRVVASELVSNVVQHTDDGGTVRAWDPKPDVPFRLEVEDSDDATPQAATDASEQGGRGLHIVDDRTDAWGVEHTTPGKTVWAEFDRTKTSSESSFPNDD